MNPAKEAPIMMHFVCPKPLYDMLAQEAARSGNSLSSTIRLALLEFLDPIGCDAP